MNFNQRPNAVSNIKVRSTSVPSVQIKRTALNKMFLFTKEITTEVGWLGTAYRTGNVITIDDVYLLDQQVHATTTEITPEGLTAFAEELLKREDGVEIWNNLKMWGHSHVNMGISPSGQDDSQMEVFANSGHDFFIRLICNKKGDLSVDVYDYELGIETHNAKWVICEEALSQQEQVILEEMAKAQEVYAKLAEMNNKIQEDKVKQLEESLKEEIKTKVKKFTYSTPKVKTAGKPLYRSLKDVIDGVKVNVYDIFTIEQLILLGEESRTIYDLEINLIEEFPQFDFSYKDLTKILGACRQAGGNYNAQANWGYGGYGY